MRLNLKSIIHVSGAVLPFSFSIDLSDLDFFGAKPFANPIHVTGQVRNRASVLELEGVAETTLVLSCDRCAKGYQQVWSQSVETMLAETLEEDENDDIILLDKGELDLEEVFTTALVLGMDAKHLCREDCQGLCYQCGVNLNEEPCTCTSDVDPRMAVLAQLLDKGTSDEMM